MSYVKEKLKDEKITYIALVTSTLNKQAQAFFKKKGFASKDYLWYDIKNS